MHGTSFKQSVALGQIKGRSLNPEILYQQHRKQHRGDSGTGADPISRRRRKGTRTEAAKVAWSCEISLLELLWRITGQWHGWSSPRSLRVCGETNRFTLCPMSVNISIGDCIVLLLLYTFSGATYPYYMGLLWSVSSDWFTKATAF